MAPNRRKRMLVMEVEDRLALGIYKRCFEFNQTHDVLIARTPQAASDLLRNDRLDVIVLGARVGAADALARAREALGPDSETRVLAVVGDENLIGAEPLYCQGADLLLPGTTSPKEIADQAVKASEVPTVLRGSLSELSVPDLLQMLCLSHRSLMLRIQAGAKQGLFWLVKGEIYHAVCGTERGQSAINDMLLLKEGSYSASQLSGPPSRTIQRHWQHVLLEAARIGDESPESKNGKAKEPASEVRKASGVHKSGMARYRELTELGLECVRSGDLSKARQYWKAARELAGPDSTVEDEIEPSKASGAA